MVRVSGSLVLGNWLNIRGQIGVGKSEEAHLLGGVDEPASADDDVDLQAHVDRQDSRDFLIEALGIDSLSHELVRILGTIFRVRGHVKLLTQKDE